MLTFSLLVLFLTSDLVVCSTSFTCPFGVAANGSLYPVPNGKKDDGLEAAAGGKAVPASTIWCIPIDYTMERPPFVTNDNNIKNGHKLNLKFNFDVREISEVNDKAQSLSIPMYFTVSWIEDRLWINESHPAWNENMTGPLNEMTEDPKILNEGFWIPDLEIYGLEEFNSKSVLKQMAGLRIKKNKEIEYNVKALVEFSCVMVFDDYPFDNHKCNFQVGSYYYTKDIVTCSSEFDDPTGDSDRQRNLQHFVEFRDLSEKHKIVKLNTGEYATCGFSVLLSRKRYQMIFQIYGPCVLFVCVSWVSFLIPPKIVPGRMALLVTLFLVLINIFNTVRSSAPIPSSTTLNAIDTYLVFAILMVFFALLEYALVLFTINREDVNELRRKKAKLKEALIKAEGSDNPHNMKVIIDEIKESLIEINPAKFLLMQDYYKLGRFSLRRVDFLSLLTMPVIFIIFNLYYAIHYTFFV